MCKPSGLDQGDVPGDEHVGHSETHADPADPSLLSPLFLVFCSCFREWLCPPMEFASAHTPHVQIEEARGGPRVS